jgi:uncharacterized protein (TIGR00255 family)
MRKREGEALADDLRKPHPGDAKEREDDRRPGPESDGTSSRHAAGTRVKAGLEIEASDERLLKEIVFFADRSDISEELTRLRSHLDQFFTHLGKDEPVGRTLDFLLQELFRETTPSATRRISSRSAKSWSG